MKTPNLKSPSQNSSLTQEGMGKYQQVAHTPLFSDYPSALSFATFLYLRILAILPPPPMLKLTTLLLMLKEPQLPCFPTSHSFHENRLQEFNLSSGCLEKYISNVGCIKRGMEINKRKKKLFILNYNVFLFAFKLSFHSFSVKNTKLSVQRYTEFKVFRNWCLSLGKVSQGRRNVKWVELSQLVTD